MNSFQDLPDPIPPSRRIFCNRTLNLRSIKAIGYDMDYTLIHYRVEEWESCAYAHIQKALVEMGWPIENLEFDPELVTRGLIIDTELGNMVKCNRFGYVKQAMHGTGCLSFEEMRQNYAGKRVGLSADRYTFLNTLFSISEGSLFLQLVDLYDQDRLPGIEHLGYQGLWKKIRSATDAAHMEGHLKAEIIANPDRFLGPRPGPSPRAPRSTACRQGPAPHHELRVELHQAADELRLRSLPPRGHDLARSLRLQDHQRAQAELLGGPEPLFRGRRRGRGSSVPSIASSAAASSSARTPR